MRKKKSHPIFGYMEPIVREDKGDSDDGYNGNMESERVSLMDNLRGFKGEKRRGFLRRILDRIIN